MNIHKRSLDLIGSSGNLAALSNPSLEGNAAGRTPSRQPPNRQKNLKELMVMRLSSLASNMVSCKSPLASIAPKPTGS